MKELKTLDDIERHLAIYPDEVFRVPPAKKREYSIAEHAAQNRYEAIRLAAEGYDIEGEPLPLYDIFN